MSSLSKARLTEERKNWRKNRPFGFVAKPQPAKDGSVNLFVWDCIIPGKDGTSWEGGKFPVKLTFTEDYPGRTPIAQFPRGFLHPNVYPDGKVCLSILNDDEDLGGAWKASLTVGQVLVGIQELLNEPNLQSPAQDVAYQMLKTDKVMYEREVKRQSLKYADPVDDC